jgi:alkylation response protein AidB-like acyl-CoA dehydrogenase
MHIEFSEEQRMLKDSAEKYLRDSYSFDQRQETIRSAEPFSHSQWQTFAELGWLAMTLGEDAGGFGGGALETQLLCEQLGRNLVIEPYLETVVLGAGLIERGGSDSLRAQYLEALASGELQVALATAEAGHSTFYNDSNLDAHREGADYCLNGSKTVVYNGAAADVIIVLARTGPEAGNLSLLAVPAASAGLTRHSYKTYDGRNACDCTFNAVRVAADALLGEAGQAAALLAPVLNRAVVAVAAEAVGAMGALVDATVEYTRQRKQFGRSISQFQVLRHRMADMFMELELTRSLLLATAWKLDNTDDNSTPAQIADTERCVAALKAKVTKAGRYVSYNAIQLHGGIGTTDELSVGHYFKRIAAINSQFGARDFHLARFADLTRPLL